MCLLYILRVEDHDTKGKSARYLISKNNFNKGTLEVIFYILCHTDSI